jgi:serine/threonine-protein kinase
MAVLNRICHEPHRPVWQTNSNIPDELADVIDRLLEKKPSRRFTTAGAVQQTLADVLSRMQHPRPWRARRWLRRLNGRRMQVAAVAAAVVLGVAGFGWHAGWFRPAGLVSDSAANPTSTTATPPSAEFLANQWSTEQTEFANELSAIDQSLSTIARAPSPEADVLRSVGDLWIQELKVADAAVTRLEKSWANVGPDDSSTLDSSKGEKP